MWEPVGLLDDVVQGGGRPPDRMWGIDAAVKHGCLLRPAAEESCLNIEHIWGQRDTYVNPASGPEAVGADPAVLSALESMLGLCLLYHDYGWSTPYEELLADNAEIAKAHRNEVVAVSSLLPPLWRKPPKGREHAPLNRLPLGRRWSVCNMAYRMVLVGTGGWGAAWCSTFLPPNVRDGLIEVAAAVDVNAAALANAQEHLGLPPERCYTDIRQAFADNQADFCAVVVPPAQHEAVVDVALDHGAHILSEKPIADTLEGSVRIANKVRRLGRKMGVTMSHRFDQDKSTLRQELRSGRWGTLDYLVCRFTCDSRKFASWGRFRHEIPDPLMVEGAVHHLDILADLAGARCATLYADTWNPSWGEYAGDSQGHVLMRFENGVRAIYEAAKTNAVGLNGWGQEYIRAECEGATLVLSRRELRCYPYDATGSWAAARDDEGQVVPLLEQPKWANTWLVEKFVRWLDGGEPMETNVEANLQSVAMVFAAIESSRTGCPVRVQEILESARASTPAGDRKDNQPARG